jgi:hypothetical protein
MAEGLYDKGKYSGDTFIGCVSLATFVQGSNQEFPASWRHKDKDPRTDWIADAEE